MRPGDTQQTPTLSEVVRRAVDVVDPEGDQGTEDFLVRFEDRDEPIAGLLETIEEEVAEAVGALDPDGTDPAVQMCGAVVTYLAFRRDEITDVREDILRLAARAELDGDPPRVVREWLESEGIAL
ncbi:MAG: hypothetical protein QOF12_1594 [Solirubrobacteraceae bacterium]|nr:hypothetical protein [Solirubrobacteraceae bacterium]